jgi:hypothetical protein
MIDLANVWATAAKPFRVLAAVALVSAACAAPEATTQPAPQAKAPAPSPAEALAARKAEQAKLEAEARAVVAQAETDVQRARAKRALWLKAWEDLLDARKAMAASDFANAIALAKSASDLAQLGLEQLAYPAVK